MWNFIKYNNTVPIALGVLFLGTSAAFAASPEVRDAAAAAVLSQDQQVISVDNTYIANKDLANYSPKVLITGVTEDEEKYYVAYTFSTIDIDNYVWRDVVKTGTMNVSKADLGQYGDLGLYVTAQFRQIVARERQHLSEVQEAERKHISQVVVATSYSGLVGQFLDAKQETIPGYVPVVVAPVEVAQASPTSGEPVGEAVGGQSGGAGSGASTLVSIQVLGNNPARVPLGASYVDLGAFLFDPYGTNVGMHTYLDGQETSSPNIDTSTTTAYVIEYRATDPRGSQILARRIVLVGAAADPGGAISATPAVTAPVVQPEPAPAAQAPEPAATSTPATSEPAATSTPAIPEPEPTPEPAPVVVPEPASATTTEPAVEPQPEPAAVVETPPTTEATSTPTL